MADLKPTLEWTEDEFSSELQNLPMAANAFKEHGISGSYFDRDTVELLDYVLGKGAIELEELKTLMDNMKREPECIGDKRDIKTSKKLKPDKVILDAVHGNIVLPSLCVDIIDTPQFQRLRHLKQMGATSFVYPGGTHTRFEHSLGVCYLAGLLVKQLREVHKDDKENTDIEIDDKDILCVQIAGLCHDMGHGPFSHMFDNKFLPSVRKEQNKEPIKHEKLSVKMVKHMFRDPANKLVTKFRDNDLKKEDLIFIKEQIYHPEDGQQKNPCKEWTKTGREQSKSFLYQIVSNERNGVDVDKWDYLARDCLHLGMHSSFDHHRLIRFARIVKAENEYQICLRDKEIYNVYEMYHVRLSLQKLVWHHRVGAAIDLMLVDALTKVKNILKYPGNGEERPLAECVDDMEAFTHLTDNIFQDILLMKDTGLSDEGKKNLEKAQTILKSIERRKIYEFLYESPPLGCDLFEDKKPAEHEEDAKKEIFKEGFTEQEQEVLNKFCRVQLSKMDYGKNRKNPVLDLHVYSKDKPNEARSLKAHEVSLFVPQKEYCEMRFRVFTLPNNYEHFKDLLEKVKSNADKYFTDKELKGK